MILRRSLARGVFSIVVGIVVGLCAGVGSAGFLHGLTWATNTRLDRPWLLWFLPIAGIGVGFLRQLAGRATGGTDLLLGEFHEPLSGEDQEARVPARLAPYVFVGSVTTHLFGGSGGREGAAVQIAAGLSAPMRPGIERLAGRYGIDVHEVRRHLIVAALAGGFGSVFGVPFAGAIFGIEVARRPTLSDWRSHIRQRTEDLRTYVLVALVASFLGHLVTSHLGIHHVKPPQLDKPFVLGVVVVAVAAGILARAYLLAHHAVRVFVTRVPSVIRPAVGGLAVVALVAVVGSRDYLGLSLPLLDAALGGLAVAGGAFALKLVFTAVTLGSGFPGGEVTPLLCMGACLGAALASPLGGPAPVLAAVGMVATWAAASNTPMSAAVMGAELFGPIGLAVFLPANLAAAVVSGRQSVYAGQR
jgi:H+/Cl- antiporter ClcA